MTSPSRAGIAVLSTALLALLVSFMLISKHDSIKSTLYCSSSTSRSSIQPINLAPTGLEEVAKCFRVERGVFTEVLDSELKTKNGEQVTYIDGFVLPGIIESHGHILQYGEMLESVSLYGAESVAEVRSLIKKFLDAHDGEGYGTREKWIRGIGWDQAHFGGVMPTAVCYHSVTLNRANIQLERTWR
jgi:hypothetical protein